MMSFGDTFDTPRNILVFSTTQVNVWRGMIFWDDDIGVFWLMLGIVRFGSSIRSNSSGNLENRKSLTWTEILISRGLTSFERKIRKPKTSPKRPCSGINKPKQGAIIWNVNAASSLMEVGKTSDGIYRLIWAISTLKISLPYHRTDN